MLKSLLQSIFFRIHISKLISRLQSLLESYDSQNTDEYVQKAKALYDELSELPRLNNDNASGRQLLLKLNECISSKNVLAINQLSEQIGELLNTLYDGAIPLKKITKRRKFSVAGSVIILFLLVFAIAFSPLKSRYYEEKEEYDLIHNEETYKAATMADIQALKEALQKYYDDNKSYPAGSGGFDAVLASYGESKENWIPGLSPKYIRQLPVDPRKSKDSGKQYMYKSDGKDFKLIAHNPLGMEEVIRNHPELADPARPTWAFGVWTEGAKNW